jgi:hypothetical protein
MSTTGPLANGLYPIIRRARRPFIIQADDAVPASVPPPVVASPIETSKPQGGTDAPAKKKKTNDSDTQN